MPISRAVPAHTFTDKTAATEPIEIRFVNRQGVTTHVLAVFKAGNGLLGHRLTPPSSDMAESLSNLQVVRTCVFPHKAVQGWQLDVINFASHALFPIGEIR